MGTRPRTLIAELLGALLLFLGALISSVAPGLKHHMRCEEASECRSIRGCGGTYSPSRPAVAHCIDLEQYKPAVVHSVYKYRANVPGFPLCAPRLQG